MRWIAYSLPVTLPFAVALLMRAVAFVCSVPWTEAVAQLTFGISILSVCFGVLMALAYRDIVGGARW